MVVLDNGKAAVGELAVADFADSHTTRTFVLPTEDAANGTPTVNNFSNNAGDFDDGAGHNSILEDGQFNAIAVGDGTTSAASGQTGLEAELERNGLSRKSDADVKTWLEEDEANGKWKAHWETTWQVTGSESVSEVGVANNGSSTSGIMLTRQAFSSPLDVVADDVLNLEVIVSLDGSEDTSTGATGGIPFAATRELCRAIMAMETDRRGPDDDPDGDWAIAVGDDTLAEHYTGQTTWLDMTTEASSTIITWDAVALGKDQTNFGNTDTSLVDEFAAENRTDLSRKDGDFDGTRDDGGDGVDGQVRNPPDGTDPENFSFDTFGSLSDTGRFNAFRGDTVQLTARFLVDANDVVTGGKTSTSTTVQEQGVFNLGASRASDSSAVMLIRQTFASGLELVDTDIYQPFIRLQSQ